MTTVTSGTRMDSGDDIAALDTIRRGMAISPELKEGLGKTLVFAVVASFGQVIVPIAVQQTLDRGINGPGGPDVSFVVLMGVLAAAGIALTSAASYFMTSRLFGTTVMILAHSPSASGVTFDRMLKHPNVTPPPARTGDGPGSGAPAGGW